MVNPALNSALIGVEFTKAQPVENYDPQGMHPCDYIEQMAEYVATLNIDMRSIATGADAVNWSMFETLRQNPEEISLFAKNVNIFLQMIFQLAKPSSILFSNPVPMINLDFMALVAADGTTEISVINSPILHLYEKFCKATEPFSSLGYTVFTKGEMLSGSMPTYDMIVAYSDEIEHDMDYVSAHIDRLNVGGALLISNAGNSSVLYNVADYRATPQAELHEFIKADDSVAVYHIPNFIGFTIVKKIK